jgi:probable rRNA maturation factor
VSVEVQIMTEDPTTPAEVEIVNCAEAVIRRMGENPEAVDACIRVVEEEESRTLNQAYRDQDRPTNVLSFPADVVLPEEAGTAGKILGDIVICDPVVRREARTQNKNVHEHYAHMVVHGMLHLYGHDHVDPAEADVMEDLEREILSEFGIADPYVAAG